MKRRLISFILAVAMVAAMIPAVAQPAQAADYNVEILNSAIYANGTPLLITEGSKRNTTTIYIDANRNGQVDAGELSLAGAGIPNAPEDDMSATSAVIKTVYGGAYRKDFSGDAYIVMTGGRIGKIYGGNSTLAGDAVGNFTGTTYIKITGGYVNENIYLGNYNQTSRVQVSNSTTGTMIVSGNPDIRGDIHGGSTTNNLNFTGVTTGFVMQIPSTSVGSVKTDSFHNGILKTDTTTYITKGTATAPADLPITIAEGETMTVKSGSNITVNGKFVNNGTLIIEAGATLTLTGTGNANNGTLTNNGTLNCRSHSYTDDCDAVCNFCGATRSASHSWNAATCDLPKTCSVCGETEGSARGHSFQYTAGTELIETCANGCGHSATAAIYVESSYAYTGSPLTPAVVNYSQNWKGAKPAVVYENNDKAGTATAAITVGGVSLSASFTITARTLEDATVTVNPAVAVYNGSRHSPTVTVVLDGKTLVQGTDYVLTWNRSQMLSPDNYRVKVTGKGNYSGSQTKSFQIVKADFSETSLELVGTYVYDGERKTPNVITNAVTADGRTAEFIYGKSMYGTYGPMPFFTNAGTYTIYYWIIADYHNDIHGSFDFTIEKATVEAPVIAAKTYTGENQTADVAGNDYYSVFSNNGGTDVGTYDVTLRLLDAENRKWGSTDDMDLVLKFVITAAENSWITGPSITGWTYGQSASVPVAAAKFGDVQVTYTGTANDGTPYSSQEAPVKAGSYTAIFRVNATENYSGLEKQVDFTIEKAEYDLTSVRWDYSGAIAYDGLDKTVTLLNLPDGLTAQYTGNVAKAVGDYTASAEFAYDPHNYQMPVMADLSWSIVNNWIPTEYTVPVANSNGWLKEDLVVTAQEGYLVATHNTAEGVWSESVTFAQETEEGSAAFYLKNTADGTISLGKTLSYQLDKTAPGGKISFVDRTNWETFVHAITFGLFYKDEISVEVEAADDRSGVASVEYIGTDQALTLEEVKTLTDWTAYSGKFGVVLEDTKKFVYFVRITDLAGNVCYLSSDGAEYDITAPAIAGAVNGKTYYTTQTVTVTDKNLDSVMLNEAAADAVMTLPGDREASYVITAQDKAGNSATVSVTMRPIADLAQPLNSLLPDNVTSGHRQILEDVKASVLVVETDSATDAEKQALQEILRKVAQLEQAVEACQAEISRITAAVNGFASESVKSSDQITLEQLTEDIRRLLSGENLTPEEALAMQDLISRIEELEDVIADCMAERLRLANAVGAFNIATVKSSDEAALEQLKEDIQKLLNGENLTPAEAQAMQDLISRIEELENLIADNREEMNRITEEVSAFDPENVKSSDKAALEQLKEDIQKLLDSENLTPAEEQKLQEQISEIEGLEDVIEDNREEMNRITEEVSTFDPETVKSSDEAALEQLKEDIQKLLNGENLTPAEEQTMQDLISEIEGLEDVIDENREEMNRITEEVNAFNPESVKSSDEAALEQLKEDIQKLLDGENITPAEEQKLQEQISEIEGLEDVIEDNREEMKRITEEVSTFNPETVKSSDEAALEQLKEDIQKLLDGENITPAEEQKLQEQISEIEGLEDVIGDNREEMNRITEEVSTFDPESVKSSDEAALEQLKEDIQKLLNGENITPEEEQKLQEQISEIEELEDVIDENREEMNRITEEVSTFDPETVKSSDEAALEQLKEDIQKLLNGENLTPAEEQKLQEQISEIEGLEDVIGDNREEMNRITEDVSTFDPETVKSSDEAALEQLKEDIQKLLDGENITPAEEQKLQEQISDIAELEDVIEDCQDEITRITNEINGYDPDSVNSGDQTALEQLTKDIQELTDGENLTDGERDALNRQANEVASMQEDIADALAENQRIQDALSEYDRDTVTSGQKEALEDLLDEIREQLESTHLTEAETQQLNQDKQAVEELLKQIQDTGRQAQELLEDVNGYQEENVKSTDADDLEETIQKIEALLGTENLTDAEADALEEAKAKAEAMLDAIGSAAAAAATETVAKTQDVTAENVTLADQEDLEKAKAELEQALADNAGNYTEEETAAIRNDIQRIQAALEAIENVKAVEEQIRSLPQEITRKDDAAVQEVQNALDALTGQEKSLVDAELKQTLADAADAVNRSRRNFWTLIVAAATAVSGTLIAIPVVLKRKRR